MNLSNNNASGNANLGPQANAHNLGTYVLKHVYALKMSNQPVQKLVVQKMNSCTYIPHKKWIL